MNNLLILFNPYYQEDVIKQHLEILKNDGIVAFGKIYSRLNQTALKHKELESDLKIIYQETDKNNPLQLFLSDYANLFVARVTQIFSDEKSLGKIKIPTYYKEKNLAIEHYFIIEDLRELVRDNFTEIRDTYLANFRVPRYHNSTYAIYGNSYVYPLPITLKQENDYFMEETKHYLDVYQNDDFLRIKKDLILYNFGEKFLNVFACDTLSNIINAELAWQKNKDNPLYDFSSLVLLHSKSIEQELFLLFCALAKKFEEKIGEIEYKSGEFYFKLKDLPKNSKPSLMSYISILKNQVFFEMLKNERFKSKQFILYKLSKQISALRNIRNESVHDKKPSLEQAKALRAQVLGVGESGMLIEIIKAREEINSLA